MDSTIFFFLNTNTSHKSVKKTTTTKKSGTYSHRVIGGKSHDQASYKAMYTEAQKMWKKKSEEKIFKICMTILGKASINKVKKNLGKQASFTNW